MNTQTIITPRKRKLEELYEEQDDPDKPAYSTGHY